MTIENFIKIASIANLEPDYQRLYVYREHVNSRLPYFKHISHLIITRYNLVIHLIQSGVPVNQSVAFAILYYKYSKQYNEMYIDQNITFDQIIRYSKTMNRPLSISYLVTVDLSII